MDGSITSDNASGVNPSDLLRQLNDSLAVRYLPVIIYMFLLLVIGILGNVIVCIVYVRKTAKTSTDYFILNLAFLDILTCLIGIPTEIADLRYPYMFYSPVACKLFRTIESLSTMGSTITLMAISVDRYKRICKLGARFSKRSAKRICISAVLIGALTCWPAAVVFGSKTVDVGIPGARAIDCSTADDMRNTAFPLIYYAIVLLYFVVCVVFVIVVYTRISLIIRRTNSAQRKNRKMVELEQESSNSTGHETRSQDKKAHSNTIRVTRTTTIFIAVTVAFIVSFLPFLSVMVIRYVKKNFEDILSPETEVLYKFCLKSYLINNAINPVIYSFLNKQFRKQVKELCMCKCNTYTLN